MVRFKPGTKAWQVARSEYFKDHQYWVKVLQPWMDREMFAVVVCKEFTALWEPDEEGCMIACVDTKWIDIDIGDEVYFNQ